jgi:hypothetical protein
MRFRYSTTDPTQSELDSLPRLPFVLRYGKQVINVVGLVDSGATVNVLPYRLVPLQGESDISVIASAAKQSPRSREKPIAWHKWGLLRRSAPRNDMHHNHAEKVLVT